MLEGKRLLLGRSRHGNVDEKVILKLDMRVLISLI
jgi:hypothetical protein